MDGVASASAFAALDSSRDDAQAAVQAFEQRAEQPEGVVRETPARRAFLA